MKTAIILTGAFAIGLFAQDAQNTSTPDASQTRAYIKGQVGGQITTQMATAVALPTFAFIGGQLLGGPLVTGQPYSAEGVTETTQTLGDGTHISNQTSSMIYRDSEGRERRENTLGKLGPWNASGTPPKIVFISDPVAKVSYTLDENAHTAHKMPAPPSPPPPPGAAAFRTFQMPAPMPPPPPGAVEAGATISSANVMWFSKDSSPSGAPPKAEQLGTQMIGGVQAQGTRTTITIPAGQIGNDRDLNIVDERWYSPELQVVVMSKHSDPRMGDSDYTLTNINRAEPDPTLFQVPADYTITEPASVHFDHKN